MKGKNLVGKCARNRDKEKQVASRRKQTCMMVPSLEEKVQGAWSQVWSFCILWWLGVLRHLLLLVHHIFYQAQNWHSHLAGDLRALHASICWWALLRFQLSTTHHSAKITTKWFAGHSMTATPTCLIWTWSRESVGHCQDEDKMLDVKILMSWRKGTVL